MSPAGERADGRGPARLELDGVVVDKFTDYALKYRK